jgi:hypothetical protein
VILFFGGFTLRRITEHSCMISSLALSGRFLMLFSMLHRISSIGILRGAMEKLRPFSSNLVVFSSMGWVYKFITRFLGTMVLTWLVLYSRLLTCLLSLLEILRTRFGFAVLLQIVSVLGRLIILILLSLLFGSFSHWLLPLWLFTLFIIWALLKLFLVFVISGLVI